ncbi:MAG: hypothetical protein S4CHLAM6_01820 [Chlamydiae bacterium]|nr:hypothetical protein [Chlamydiota bacterium]
MEIGPTFAVIYRFYLQPSKEKEYISSWKEVTNYFIKHRGAISSTLHKTENGYWLAYSKWPSKETRDASWVKDDIKSDLPEKIKCAIEIMKNCSDLKQEQFSDICSNIIEHTD